MEQQRTRSHDLAEQYVELLDRLQPRTRTDTDQHPETRVHQDGAITVWRPGPGDTADWWLIHKRPQTFTSTPKRSKDYVLVNDYPQQPMASPFSYNALQHLREAFAALQLHTQTQTDGDRPFWSRQVFPSRLTDQKTGLRIRRTTPEDNLSSPFLMEIIQPDTPHLTAVTFGAIETPQIDPFLDALQQALHRH